MSQSTIGLLKTCALVVCASIVAAALTMALGLSLALGVLVGVLVGAVSTLAGLLRWWA
jgi:hypothetical protein